MSNEDTCRICLQEENLVRVCKCNSKVHMSCLNTWRHVRARQSYALPFVNNFLGVRNCEVCLRPYRIENEFHVENNPKIVRKYICKMTLDFILFFGLLATSYVFFGWVATPLWKPDDPHTYGGEDAVRVANGVMWTHMIITLVVIVSGLSRGCMCVYVGDDDCEGEGAVVVVVILSVIGILLAFAFVLTEIVQKRMMQMNAELYLSVESRNTLDEISISL